MRRVFSSWSTRPNLVSRSFRAASIRCGVVRFLEAHYEVVSITHDHKTTMRVPAAPLSDPEIEDVVQKDVGQERTDARALRRSPVRLTPLTAFQDTGLEPHPDEPEDAPIGDPMREHPHQPLTGEPS